MSILTREDIKTALAEVYRTEYAEYFRLQDLADSLIREDKAKAHKTIARRAVNRSYFLEGVRRSAEALGISAEELADAASGVQPAESRSAAWAAQEEMDKP